jgi:DNA-binding transcriptional ArsR family regulator
MIACLAPCTVGNTFKLPPSAAHVDRGPTDGAAAEESISLDIHIPSEYIHIVTERRPALLPLLRSENQLRLLATLLLAPERTWTMNELSHTTGVPQPSVSREVARLRQAGVVRVEGSRNNRQVSAEVDSVIFPELQGLLLKTVGPKPVLETGLSDVAGIESAFIYGSWARRYEGEAGAPPGDIDLLVVGTPKVDAVYDVTERASAQFGREVNPTVLTKSEWEASSEGFLEQLRRSPLVSLDLSYSHAPVTVDAIQGS